MLPSLAAPPAVPSRGGRTAPGGGGGSHLPGLDGLRGIAILAVLLHHFLPPNYPQGIPGGAAGVIVKVYYRLFDVGWWGVDLFFVLSGFLITGVLLEAKGTEHFFRNFYARRSLRIFPLYYGVLFVLFILLPALAGTALFHGWIAGNGTYLLSQQVAPKQAWLWLYGTNVKTAIDAVGWTFGSLTHFWSLAVEEHFYLVWPLVVFCCSSRTLVRVCLAVALGSVVARGVCLSAGMAPAYIFVLTPCRLDGLALGALVAVLGRGPGGLAALLPGVRRTLKIVAPAAVLALLTLNRFGTFMIIIGHTLLAVTFAAVLPVVAVAVPSGVAPSKARRWLGSAGLRLFGKHSYGIYVLHPFILTPVDQLASSAAVRQILGNSYIAYALARASLGLLCALTLGMASWYLYEKHFLRLKAFFPTGHRRWPLETRALAPVARLPFAGSRWSESPATLRIVPGKLTPE